MIKLKNKLSNAFYIVLCLVFFSCNDDEPRFYEWQTTIEVKYSDNTKDVVINKITLHRDQKPKFYIRTESKGFVDNTKLVPCVVMKSKYEMVNVACDVKRFEILKQVRLAN